MAAAGSRFAAMSSRVTIIGYGNPLRGDDGAGQRVALELARRRLADCEVVTCHQLTPELAETLAATDLAVFIDARAGAVPGSVNVAPITAAASCGNLGHHIEPGALLTMAQLYGRPPAAVLVTLGAASFGPGEGLSPAVTAALPQLVATVAGLIDAHRQARTVSSTVPPASTN